MMQVTGNNSPVSGKNIESIQLWLGGLCSSICSDSKTVTSLQTIKMNEEATIESIISDFIDTEHNCDVVNIIIDTLDSILVPSKLYDPSMLSQLLTMSGVDVSIGDIILVSPEVQGVRAIMKYSAKSIELLQLKFANITYWTPLLIDVIRKRDSLMLSVNDSIVHISLMRGGAIEYAEALSYNTMEDLLYYVETLSSELSYRCDKSTPIIIGGSKGRIVEKSFKSYYKYVEIEQFSDFNFDDSLKSVEIETYSSLIKVSGENY